MDMKLTEFVPYDWLFGAVDMDEIERDWLNKPGPYGVPKQEWEKLKLLMKDGDEIRAFSSPEDSWRHLAGRAGYALVREGKAIDGVITLMN